MPRNQTPRERSSIAPRASQRPAKHPLQPAQVQADLAAAVSSADAQADSITTLTPHEASRLQRTIGNRALGRLLASKPPPAQVPSTSPTTVRRAPLVAGSPARPRVATQDTFFRAQADNASIAATIQRASTTSAPVVQRQLNLEHSGWESWDWNATAKALMKDFDAYLVRIAALFDTYSALIRESFQEQYTAADYARSTWNDTKQKIAVDARPKVRIDLDNSLKVLDALEKDVPARKLANEQREQEQLDAQKLKEQQEREAKEKAEREEQDRIRQKQEKEQREEDEKKKNAKIEEVNKSLDGSRQHCVKQFKLGMPANVAKWYAEQQKIASALPGMSLEQVESFAQSLKNTGNPMILSWQEYWKLQSAIPANVQAECLAHLDSLGNDARTEHTAFLAAHNSHFELAYTALKGAHGTDPASAIATAKQEMVTNAAYNFDPALRASVESKTSDAVNAASQIKIDAIEAEFKLIEKPYEVGGGNRAQKDRRRERNDKIAEENRQAKAPYEARIRDVEAQKPAQVEALRTLIRDFIKANPALQPLDAKTLAEWAIKYAGADPVKLKQALAAYALSAPLTTPAVFIALTKEAATPDDVPWALGIAKGNQALATSLLRLLGNAGKKGKEELKALGDLMPDIARTVTVDLVGLNQQQLLTTCNTLAEELPGKKHKAEGGRLADEMIVALRGNGAGLTPQQLHDLTVAMTGKTEMIRHCKKLAGAKDSLNQFFPTLLSLLITNKGWQMAGVAGVMQASLNRRKNEEAGAVCELLCLANLHDFTSAGVTNAINAPDIDDLNTVVTEAKRFIAQANKGNKARKPDGEGGGGVVASHDFTVTTPATADDPEFETEYTIEIYASRQNHFVNGHTYKHFEFTLANINRGVVPQDSTLYTVEATSAADVLADAERTIATQEAQNLAERVAAENVDGYQARTLGGYVVGFKRLNDVGNTHRLELTQFYPAAGDTLYRHIAKAIGRLFGTIVP